MTATAGTTNNLSLSLQPWPEAKRSESDLDLALPLSGQPQRSPQETVNRILLLLLCLWLADSVTLGTLWDTYLQGVSEDVFGQDNSNRLVGIVETTRGMIALLASFPLGHLSDKVGRLWMLRGVALSVGLPGLACVVIGLLIGEKQELYQLTLFIIGMSAYAVFFQASTASVDALIGDALPPGPARTAAYGSSRGIQAIGRACGPLLQALLFWIIGSDQWSHPLVKAVLLCGNIVYVVFFYVLFTLEAPPKPEEAPRQIALVAPGTGVDTAEDNSWQMTVPLFIQLFNLIFMLGSGMMLKYCPLYFKDANNVPQAGYGLPPIGVFLIMGSYWVCSAIGTKMAQPLLKWGCPRTILSLTLHIASTLALFAFAMVYPLWMSVAMFMVRALLTNATLPLNTALLMDHTSPANRGKWAALNSLNRATWSGSCLIGSAISDAHGYRASFFVTAIVFSVAGLAFSPLLCIIPKS